MEDNKPTIDFDTMRSNCIQIHQEMYLMFLVSEHIGEDLKLIVKSADELRTHPETKNWDGMGRFAKTIHDSSVWDLLPESLWVKTVDGNQTQWIKNKAKNMLLDCYYQLGGKNLYKGQSN